MCYRGLGPCHWTLASESCRFNSGPSPWTLVLCPPGLGSGPHYWPGQALLHALWLEMTLLVFFFFFLNLGLLVFGVQEGALEKVPALWPFPRSSLLPPLV